MRNPDETPLFTAAPLPQATLDDAQRLACLRLIRSDNIGPVAFRELINHFGGAAEALAALPDLARRGGGRKPIRLCTRERAEAELDAAARAGAVPVFTIEPGYPAALAAVDVPPPLIYVRGRLDLLIRPMVGIVGSRQSSGTGLQLAAQFASALGQMGYVIVSGLARGIDGAAHRASIATGTVAVVAGGIDHIYPPEHADLQERIATQGCIVTEMAPGFKPRATDFPRRNRIIAGMASGVVIVEAARRSGTLITARMANEIGREVFAVPGHPLDPRAEGTNQLLKDGATLVTSADDIAAALSLQTGVGTGPAGLREKHEAVRHWAVPEWPAIAAPPLPASGPDESDRDAILSALGPAPISVDQLARVTGLGSRAVQIVLLELTMAGRLDMHGQQLVSLKMS